MDATDRLRARSLNVMITDHNAIVTSPTTSTVTNSFSLSSMKKQDRFFYNDFSFNSRTIHRKCLHFRDWNQSFTRDLDFNLCSQQRYNIMLIFVFISSSSSSSLHITLRIRFNGGIWGSFTRVTPCRALEERKPEVCFTPTGYKGARAPL